MAKVLIRSLDDYQRSAVATDVSKGTDSPSFILLGLFGEAGSVLSEIKKRERDNLKAAAYIHRIVEELGDLLWYVAAAAARNDILLSEIGTQIAISHKKLISNEGHDLGFADIQSVRKVINVKPTLLLEWNLISLAESVGKLVSDHRTFLKKRDRTMLIDSFVTVLNEMIAVANRVGISLEIAAVENLRKTQNRWPRVRRPLPYFDVGFPRYEQIPRQLEVTIQEQKTPGGGYFVHQICNGINIGDRVQ